MLIEAARSCLLMVDMQERLLPAIHGFERVIENCGLLLQVAEKLDLPLIVTEQYPKGLGPTVPELESKNATIFEKLSFSGLRDEKIRAHFKTLEDSGFKQVIMCGVEAHVCVLQTALDLKLAGFEVFVVADACSSRSAESVALALPRLRHNGVQVVDAEMAIFELAGKAGTPEFKALSALIK
ncbi:MAG: hydrolase [Aestuariivirga sp.]